MSGIEYTPDPGAIEAMEKFTRSVPGTSATLEQHIEDWGEVLPHLLMADLRQQFVEATESDDRPYIVAFLAGIERLLTSPNENVRNVADVSFVDDLTTGDERELAAITAMRRLIGPATAESLRLSEEARS